MMKKFLLVLAFAILTPALYGQDIPGEIRERIQDSRISLDYSCTIKGKVPVKSSGTILVQRECYCVKTSALEIFCNGSTRWVVDRESKEVYVEAAEGTGEFIKKADSYLKNIEDLNIRNVSYSPIDKDLSAFVFDCTSLPDNWVVTDLR